MDTLPHPMLHAYCHKPFASEIIANMEFSGFATEFGKSSHYLVSWIYERRNVLGNIGKFSHFYVWPCDIINEN
jgi:hypothetical protein